MGKLGEFEILYDQPQDLIYNGGIISGRVVTDVNEGIKLRGIRINLNGSASVHWTERRTRTRNNKTEHYSESFYGHELYFDVLITLWGKNKDDKTGENLVIAPGHYEFPFSAQLPNTLPSSFEGGVGKVRYFGKAIIDRPWKFDYTTKKPFTVIAQYDLNTIPTALEPAASTNQKTICCCCCKSGPIAAEASIPRIGYVPGESIPIRAAVDNNSRREINKTNLRLQQILVFHATRKSKTIVRPIAEFIRGKIPARGQDVWPDFSIPIPPVPASELKGCNIIEISYQLEYIIEPDMASNFKVGLPIVIGTIPLINFMPHFMDTSITPSAPEQYPDMNPPSYNECMFGATDIRDESDSEFTRGKLSYTPLYPTYISPAV